MRRRPHLAVLLALPILNTSCSDDGRAKSDAGIEIRPAEPDGGIDVDPVEPDADVDMSMPPTDMGDDGDEVPPDMPPDMEPLATEVCTVIAGDARKVVSGTLLTPTGLREGSVAIDAAGTITCVGTCAPAGGETLIACAGGVVSPGLINTHDHITYTQNAPYMDTGERYEHRHDWRTGRRGHTEIITPGGASPDQVRWGELRFLLGGATSTVGSGGAPGLLRNLDAQANQEGLGQAAVRLETFPLDDASGTQRTSDCNYGAAPDTAATIMNLAAYEPHLAEGIDGSARNEFLCASSETYDTTAPGLSHDLVAAQTAIIHGLGLKPFDYGVMATDGAALIWSPRSNITLYGDTAQAQTAARMGVQIALGTDWIATGSSNLLRELACADSVNATYWNGYFADRQLWAMVTENAAAVTATDDVIGALAVGRVADIVIFDGRVHAGYRAIIEGEPKDVALVMRAGKPLYGEAATIAELSPTGCDALDVCGHEKHLCLLSEIGKSYAELAAAVGSAYPAFFCGVPTNEPTCTPQRPAAINAVNGSTTYTGVPSATDLDGDGIANASDNCPNVFNPVRPVDDGAQGDSDGDGVGDACDVCPVDASTSTCATVDPRDRDGDGVPNAVDNCADFANAGQEDGDGDRKGDVCDACPTLANPGSANCPVSIYSIKSGATPIGAMVRVENALVTGEGQSGFFVQVKSGDPGYTGPDNSGIFVFTSASSPYLAAIAVGNRVTVDGTVASFNGQVELDALSNVTAVSGAIEAAPAPVSVTAAEIARGGPRAAALESVLVQIGAATVAEVNTAEGEFTVTDSTGSVPIDDYLFAPTPSATVGQAFGSIAGVLALRGASTKVEPRSAADLPPTVGVITAFGPATSFVRVGQTNVPTFPTPLTVTLSGPAATPTTVTVSSGNGALATTPLVIPSHASSGQVLVSGISAGTATITASLSTGGSFTASVRALSGSEVPALTSLTPTTATITPNGAQRLVVNLDLPAPAGGTVVNLALSPQGAGTLPATVTVQAGQVSTSFDYVHSGAATSVTVSASLGAAPLSSTLTIAPATRLVINEVDYDQTVNPDGVEYVEIHNPTGGAASLAGIALVLVNGSNNVEYRRIDLGPAGSIPAGGYLVVGAAAVTALGSGVKYTPPTGSGASQWPATDAIQNGAPDGIALVDVSSLVVLDALSYEGAIDAATLTGIPAPTSLVEGTVATALDSGAGALCRMPNGTDSNNAVTDWTNCASLTPGAANVP